MPEGPTTATRGELGDAGRSRATATLPDDHRAGHRPSTAVDLPPTLLELATLLVAMAIATCGGVSFVAAALGVWNLPAVLALTACLVFGQAWLLGRSTGWRFGTEAPATLLALGLLLAVFLLVTLPGFRSGMTGWDPGVYQVHAQSIAETGTLHRENPVAALELQDVADAHYPGLVRSTEDPRRAEFGFFHLYPALGAVGYGLGRTLGVAVLNPLIGAVGITAVFLLVRRLTRTPAIAAVATFLVASSPVWLWHSQLTTSEMVTVTLLVCGALAGAAGWHGPPALLVSCGYLIGMASVARADGLLIIAAGSGVVAVLRYQRSDRSWLALAGGLAPGAALWFVQAYETAADYAVTHDVPEAWTSTAVVAFPILAAWALCRHGSRPFERVRDLIDRRFLSLIRLALVGYVLVLLGFVVRAWSAPAPAIGTPPSFAPHTIGRLAIWLTPGGVVLVAAGALALAASRRFHSVLLVLAPGLLVLPVYLVHPRIHPRFIWWTRRFLPMTWLPVLLLAALGAAWLWQQRSSPLPRTTLVVTRVLAAVSLLWVAAANLMVNRAIVEVEEMGGSSAFPDQIVAMVEPEGVLLWTRQDDAFYAFGVATMVRGDLDVVPVEQDGVAAAVEALAPTSRPLYVLADEPPGGVAVEPLGVVAGEFEYLGFTYDRLPDEVARWPFATAVYEVVAPAPRR